MKRPSVLTYVLGNTFCLLAILAGGGFFIYQWWHGLGSDIVPIVAGLLMIMAVNAGQRLSEYGNWKRAWDAMADNAPPPRRRGRWRPVVGTLILALYALALVGLDYSRPKNVLAAVCFGVTILILIGATIYRAAKRKSGDRARPTADVPVTISLPVPRTSPDIQQMYQGLPDYCAKLG
jgi:uncharacterized membrane protein YbhN (UPF0104 family)